MNEITHWAGKPGQRIALVFVEEVVDVDLTSYSTARPFAARVMEPGFMGIVQSHVSRTDWSYTAKPAPGISLRGTEPTKEAAADALRQAYVDFWAEKRREAADPAYALEKMLQGYDWYAHMSDDHSVWSAGERASRDLEALKALVDPATVAALLAKYGPK